MTPTYKIVRFFVDPDITSQVVAEGLSLEEAREWCNDPETSSRTATSKEAKDLTEEVGPWFDGYEEE